MKFEINAKKFIKSIEAAIKVSRKGIKDSDFFNVTKDDKEKLSEIQDYIDYR